MEEEQTPEKQDVVLGAEHEINLQYGKAENNPAVRKSSRPRKQSKRILDSAECEDDELVGIPLHKKHRKGLKVRTHRRKDVLQNGRPFKCSLCESPYINNCPAKAKVKKELQPIVKEKFGQLLQLCVKCAIAVNHTENKGPTPEQRAEFEEEGKQFAQRLVKYLSDSAAARLYCSFYQTTKCGCIQCFITGTQANRRRKTSVSGGESELSDIAELKGEDGATSTDKADQTERAKYLLSLLKESMAKKQAQNTKTSNDKSQQTRSDNAGVMKESETFILENRVKLKELGICERGCQKVLCYSNNFLHKKSFGSQPRLQRTKGRAALGRLHALEDLSKMRCCEKNCVKLAVKNQSTLADWRQRAQNGQKEMWKVLEEMLTFTDSGRTSCYKFICMVTGCCLTTVQKVYAEILLFRGTTSCPSQKEHGMRFHWKRQKELGKLLKVQAMATTQDQPLQTEPLVHCSAVAHDASFVPTLIADKTLSSAHLPDVQTEQKAQFIVMAVGSPAEIGLPLGEKVADGKEDNKDIKEKLLQLFENIKDPKELANMQQILAELQRDLKVKQEREHTQKVSASGISLPSSAALKTEPLSSSICLASSTPLALVSAMSQTPNYSSSAASVVFPQDTHPASVSISKIGRPFVHIKVPQTAPEQRTSIHHIPQVAIKERTAAATETASLHMLRALQNTSYSPLVEDTCSVPADASSQQLAQHTLLSRPCTGTGKLSTQPKTPLPAVSSSCSRSSMAKATSVTVSSGNSLNDLPQQVGLFHMVAPSQTEASQMITSQASQMLPVYPQTTSLQLQPLSLSASNSAQNIQLQLVSPLIIGQSNLMIPLSQPGTMSFILHKPAADSVQDSQSFLQALPLTSSSSISHRDFVISHVSPMQNYPAPAQSLSYLNERLRNTCLSTCPSQTECNLTFSNSICNVQCSSASANSEVKENTEAAIQNLRTHLSHLSELAEPHAVASEDPTNRNSMPQDDSSRSHSATAALVHFQGNQSCGQQGELFNQVSSIDQYFPSQFLNPAAGNSSLAAPSSCASSSFVFDALAESPVKDSLPSASLHPVAAVTSSLLCEMLMSSAVPSLSSSLSLVTSSSTSQAPVYTMNAHSSGSGKPSLLSSVKLSPSASAYCQSINFSTHTTPSSLSTQPVIMVSKAEQTSLPIAVTIGHNASLSHSQISVSRLNRQRDPPQVGIVHPHVSGGKASSGGTVNSHACSSASSLGQNSVYTSSASVTAATAENILGGSHSSDSSSCFMSVNNSNVQVAASVQQLSADILHNQQHPQQQHLLMSLLLNSQNASLPNKTLINIPQANQFNLSALLGNPGTSVANTITANDGQKQQTNCGNQNQMNASGFHVSPHIVPNLSLQNTVTDNGNFLQTPLSVGSLMPASIGNQSTVSGNASTQLPVCDSHMFYSNAGHVKLVPVILSDGSYNGSAPSLFAQNGQLLLNMSPCAGLGSGSSMSPQNLNRDRGILLNLSPNSGQNTQLQHPLLQIEDVAQTSSAPPLTSTSTQNIQHSRETSFFSKDQTQAVQVSVLPFGNQPADSQFFAQIELQGDSNLTQSLSSKESLNANSLENKMSMYTLPNSLRPAVETAAAQHSHSDLSHSQSVLPTANTAQNVHCQDNQSSENHSGQNVLVSCNLVKATSIGEAPHKIAEVARSVATSLPVSSLTETERSGLTGIIMSEQQNPLRETRNKSQICLVNQNRSEDQQYQLQSQQLPLQIVSVVQTQPTDQTNADKFMAPNMGTSFVLDQPAFQNFGLGQQSQSLLSLSGPNQIFLPIQSVPFSSHSDPRENISKINQELQLGQQLSELHKQTTVKSADAGPLLSAGQATKNVSTHIASTSTQSSVASSGSYLANIVASGTSSSRHRPIRPKLHPVPLPASKISLMLVPDKPGYPAYQLTQLDSASLPFQQVPEQSSQSQPVSQQPQNVLLNPATSLQKQNSLSIAETSKQQSQTKPAADAAFVTQLQLNQQPSGPAQILLLSQTELAERSQNSETQAVIGQNEILTLSSEQMDTSIHALPAGSKECITASQSHDIPEMISQQMVSVQPGSFQIISDCGTHSLPFLQNETLKFSSSDSESFELRPFENKEYRTGIFSNESMFVNTSQGTFSSEALRSATFDVSSLQNSGFDSCSQQTHAMQFDCVDNTPVCSSSQAAVSQCPPLSLDSSQLIPMQHVAQTDIQRLNPQIASQLSSGDVQRLTHHNLIQVNMAGGLGDLVLTTYNGSQILQISQPGNHHQTLAHPDVKLDSASSSGLGSSVSSFTHAEHLPADATTQAAEDNSRSFVALDVRQMATSTFTSVQNNEIKASPGLHFSAAMISNQPVASSEVPVYTQFPHKLIHPSALMLDVKVSKSEDTKPVIGPIQYLQCKDIIDLTEEDSPPLSPNSISMNKRKTVGLVPILSNQVHKYGHLQKQSSENVISGQQPAIRVPLNLESLTQPKQAKAGQCLPQQWTQLKQEGKETHGRLRDHVLAHVTEGSDFLLCGKELGPNVPKLEEISEDIRQVLLASLESHAAGNPDVHLVTKAFTPADDLKAFLSLHSVTDNGGKTGCLANAVMMSSNQQTERLLPLARTQSQNPSSVPVSDGKLVYIQPGNKQLSQTCRSGASKPSPDLSLLSSATLTDQLKQGSGLPFTVHESAVSTTRSLASDVTAAVSSSVSSSFVVSATSSHQLAGASTSCPPLLMATLNTALPRSPIVKPPLRTVIHPLTSSTVAFIRTNTPTEAVGPPNITIMSAAQASTSPHLRLRHENSASVSTSASNPLVNNFSPKPVSTMVKNHSSRPLKINSSAFSAPAREQGTLEIKTSQLSSSASEEKTKAASQSSRRLSFENSFSVRSQKEVTTTETSSLSIPVGTLLKPPQAVTPSRSKSRKKPSTIMDLLRSKEKLQATASALSSAGFPANNTAGPVAFMISGTPDLLLMESSAGQAGINSVNIAVKNMHLLDKLTSNEDTYCVPKQISSSSQPSGFTVLQPNILPSVSGNFNIVSTPTHIRATTATEQTPSTAAVSGSSVSQVQSQSSVSMTASRPHKITASAENAVSAAAKGSAFIGSMSVPNIAPDVFAQSVTLFSQSPASLYRPRDHGLEVPGKGYSASCEASSSSSSTAVQDSDFKHTHLQEVSKCDSEAQFQPVGQPQVVCGSFNLLNQKPASENFHGEKLKFKTTTTQSKGNGDRRQELISGKFRLLEDTQTNLSNQNTGTIKKLLLLNEKSTGESSKVHSGSMLRSSIQIGDNSQQGSTNEKHLPQKSPQLLHLMKSKQPLSYTDFEPAVNARLSHSFGAPLKLPISSVSMAVSSENLVYDYNSSGASAPLNYNHLKEDFKQKDQLHVFKTESSVPVLQPKENKTGLLEATGNMTAVEAMADSRINLLPSQHPRLSTILFSGDSSSLHLQTLPSETYSKSPVHFDNQPNSSGKRRDNTEGDSYINQHVILDRHASPNQLGHAYGGKGERHMQLNFESEESSSVSGLSSLVNRAPPAYSHPPRYENTKKDMTRVSRVIEDIYKFPDEGEEPSPPPVLGSLKGHKFTYTHRWQVKSPGSFSNSSVHLSQSSENTEFAVASNKKSSAKTVQNTSGNSSVSPSSKYYISSHASSNSAQTWRSPKKLKAKREQDRSHSKINLKKVQFSDVVTSKSAHEYGQSTSVNSSVDTSPSDTSNRWDKTKCPVQDYSVEDSRNLGEKHERLEKDRHDDRIVYEKHPYAAEQLESEFREGKGRTHHSGLLEAPFTRPEDLQVNMKNKGNTALGVKISQRETDSVLDFEPENQFGRDVQKVFQHQHPASGGYAAAAADGEQKFKHRGGNDVGPFQTQRPAHENPCVFQSGYLQESMDTMYSFANERTDAGRMHSVQNAPKSCEQIVVSDTLEGMSTQCEDVIRNKVDENSRDLTKRRQAVHGDNLQFSANRDHELHSLERNNYMTDKKEFDFASVSCDRDSKFDQQSSFNILSTQGYSKLSRHRLYRTDTNRMWGDNLSPSPFKPHGMSIEDTAGTSDHYEGKDFPYQNRCEPLPTGGESSNVDRQLSESPLTRQKILESNFEIARQMKKGHVRVLEDSRSELSEGRRMESPQPFYLHPDRSEDLSGSQLQRDTESQMNIEMEYRTPSVPANNLTSPIFSNTLDGRPDVLTSLESLSCLRKEIKDLKGENIYLKLEVAKAEQKEKEQLRQRKLSSSDKQRAVSTEMEKTEKSYYASSSNMNSQQYMADSETVAPIRKRHASSTTTLGALNYSLFPGSELVKPEESFQSKVCQLPLGSSGMQQMLDTDMPFQDGNHRVSAADAVYVRSSVNIGDSPEHYIRDTRDPLVSSSMSSHSRPASQLDLSVAQYELSRHKYSFSDIKSGPLRSVSDGDGFVPLQEHTRHRNLSSSLGFQNFSDIDPPPYDMTQRQRNPSTSSLKSTLQDADILNLEGGARSRNPSSSSWIRYLDYGNEFAIIRSRNPSGSSNRRSRPGSSSSSEREHPVNMDELPLFSDIAHTRSRNSSGESIEPTVDLILDPQQFMQYTQYTYQSAEAHSKRTKH